ncbi:hypothetical protein FHS15_003623 [Paenibacillus castaneae]|uniref:hypothetical protein n=1 Tax=Paenibacillus castaneae TaxID=474957 RepID=UPI000C9AB7FA|nr:hypothetical protein [Paenibacillus castaneae]NIK78485.1 hypothetical protein [Paenibacillus castaneae]
MKRGVIIGLVVVAVLAAVLLFLFRMSEERVVVQRMIDFENEEPNSEMEWTDRDSVKTFVYGVRFAKKEQGIVDISAPPYSFKLGENRYLLWISPQFKRVQFAKSEHSGTLYTMRQATAERLKKLLSQADERYGVIDQGAATDDAADSASTPLPSMEESEPPVPAFLDTEDFSEAERPLIELINLRIKYIAEGEGEKLLELYTESARASRSSSGPISSFTITSIEIDGAISIKEQSSLFEAVVHVIEERNNEAGGSSTLYVFQKGKNTTSEWRIADVD